MRERLAGAVVVSLFFGVAACGDGGGGDPGGGGTGGIVGPCAGIERVCNSPVECPSLRTCDACGVCIVDPGIRSCEDTSDCPIGRACRVPEGGTEKSCVRMICNAHTDCADGEACDLERHACVPGDCVALGCPEGTYCREEDSTCVECIADINCAGTEKPYCVEERNTCVVCEIDSDCAPGMRCAENYECVSCETNADCVAPNRICRDDGLCVMCLTNADCPGVPCLESGRCDLGPIAGEACDPGRVCAPGYRCEGNGTGTCFQACQPYEPACGNNEYCALIADENGQAKMDGDQPAGICVRDGGGGGVGAICDATHDCRADLVCLPENATTDRCRKPCDAVEVCAANEACEGLPIGANDASIGFCMAPTTWGDVCARDADCDAGQGCVLGAVDGELVYSCQFTEGTKAALEPCTTDAMCRSGFCLNDADNQPGFCFGACESAADCGGELCGHMTFNLADGGTADTPACRATCDRNADCARYGEFVCGVAFDRVDLQLFGECARKTGAAAAGEACTTDAGCAAGFCLDSGGGGICVGICETDADCAGGLPCREVAFSVTATQFDNVNVCWGAACARDGDCQAGWACGFEADPANPTGSIRFSCRPGVGSLPAGALCSVGTDCLGGQCVGGTCFGTCTTDEDCAEGAMCFPEFYSYETDDGTIVGIDGCVNWG